MIVIGWSGALIILSDEELAYLILKARCVNVQMKRVLV
jgi:hypothetical protein